MRKIISLVFVLALIIFYGLGSMKAATDEPVLEPAPESVSTEEPATEPTSVEELAPEPVSVEEPTTEPTPVEEPATVSGPDDGTRDDFLLPEDCDDEDIAVDDDTVLESTNLARSQKKQEGKKKKNQKSKKVTKETTSRLRIIQRNCWDIKDIRYCSTGRQCDGVGFTPIPCDDSNKICTPKSDGSSCACQTSCVATTVTAPACGGACSFGQSCKPDPANSSKCRCLAFPLLPVQPCGDRSPVSFSEPTCPSPNGHAIGSGCPSGQICRNELMKCGCR